MNYDVPWLPDPGYIDFLIKHEKHIESIHFSLHSLEVLDARVRSQHLDINRLVEKLNQLQLTNVKRYCLLNTRFIQPDHYFDTQFIKNLLGKLDRLIENANLTGIIFCDLYLLKRLSKFSPETAAALEAVPGINCMIDSFDKAEAFLDQIAMTFFKPPGKMVLDRSLNRNLPLLDQVTATMRKALPGISIELLANEGCLLHCPFKASHDAHIALAVSGLVKERTFELGRETGCIETLFHHPELLFKSPFIRPEDVQQYKTRVDCIKLCGRTLGPEFLKRVVSAYLRESYTGNLLDLFDAAVWMSSLYHVDNKKMGEDAFNLLTNCSKDGKTCETLFHRSTTIKQMHIGLYRNRL